MTKKEQIENDRTGKAIVWAMGCNPIGADKLFHNRFVLTPEDQAAFDEAEMLRKKRWEILFRLAFGHIKK
jgi:hypothetical protein